MNVQSSKNLEQLVQEIYIRAVHDFQEKFPYKLFKDVVTNEISNLSYRFPDLPVEQIQTDYLTGLTNFMNQEVLTYQYVFSLLFGQLRMHYREQGYKPVRTPSLE